MIRRLQKKFILIAMVSLLCITSILILSVNVANFLRINRRAEDLLDLIVTRKEPPDGFRSEEPVPEGSPTVPEEPPKDSEGDAPWFSGKRGDFKSIAITPETEYTTRWFSVSFSSDGSVSVFAEKIASVSEEEAENLALFVRDSGQTTGYKGVYKYRTVVENDTETVYFLNCEEMIQSGVFLLIATVIIGIACLLLLLILLILLSRRAVKPVLENSERQKRFITDAGHELKTPLAIISANADVLAMTGEKNEWVDSIRKQTDRMGHLVQDLLTLAGQEEASECTFSDFDLSDAVSDTAMPFEPLAESRRKRVSLQIQPGIRYRGDEGSLRRLVSILMENALKYADSETEITLSLRREGKKILLVQKNFCTPLPDKEDLGRLFDRFYRADPSRSRDRGGFGIGLSIAKGIVEAHRGKISAAVQDGRICFTVVL